jgi:predicted ribosome quality control (RQC) complex YloA/Tae2 family protein
MEIRLDLKKNLQENAANYFEKAKKAKSKIEGAQTALQQAQVQAKRVEEQHEEVKKRIQLKEPETHWYHKYHWSKTRNGFLLVAGQNASANEAIIKSHAQPTDVVFHTDMAGSPFTILRADKEHTEEDLADAAQLTGAYSRAWPAKMTTLDVFHVAPEQVTKEAQSGEYLTKGSFMIRGDTTYHHPEVKLCIGVITQEGYKPEVFVGSQEACKQQCSQYALLAPGDTKTSDVAKQLRNKMGGELDAYVKAIPTGGSTITTWQNNS